MSSLEEIISSIEGAISRPPKEQRTPCGLEARTWIINFDEPVAECRKIMVLKDARSDLLRCVFCMQNGEEKHVVSYVAPSIKNFVVESFISIYCDWGIKHYQKA